VALALLLVSRAEAGIECICARSANRKSQVVADMPVSPDFRLTIRAKEPLNKSSFPRKREYILMLAVEIKSKWITALAGMTSNFGLVKKIPKDTGSRPAPG
jgi:hypothetical protein